jgi:hypothetical protein
MEEDYPQNLLEFEDRFNTEARCIEYLRALRWPEGLISMGQGINLRLQAEKSLANSSLGWISEL